MGGAAGALPRAFTTRKWWVPITVLAAGAVVLAVAVQINLVFYAYPTVGTALGLPDPDRIDFAEVPPPTDPVVTGRPLEDAWAPQAPTNLPASGRYTTVAIPGATSGFAARDAVVYLPPAYFANPRPLLPVLVMLAGQPGSPEDWLNGGKLAMTMDAFAREHHGLAPVVVVPDGTGSQLANPLCLDSQLGKVASYLAVDVPTWIKDAPAGRPRSAVLGGRRIVLRRNVFAAVGDQPSRGVPDVPRPVRSGGADARRPPTDRRQAFGGDEAAFVAVNPLDLMKSRRYPDTAGIIVVGTRDDAIGAAPRRSSRQRGTRAWTCSTSRCRAATVSRCGRRGYGRRWIGWPRGWD